MTAPTHTSAVRGRHCGDVRGVIPCAPADDGAMLHQACPDCVRLSIDTGLAGRLRDLAPGAGMEDPA